ncbi:regulator of Vps4 activity in the MVB pathway protein [Tasmannia lanceolata]|uniref:regulator of Vps4 activity in the MVB pathway protein n=1 Tax=Tasmannia lanceolata TaxID=3420 RepID=UPI0040647972
MGRKLDILFGRNSKTSKLKTLLGLAISRLAVLKNQRKVRCTQGRNDVAQLLRLGHHERALIRVEHVIKDQNMLDVFVLIEGYCHLLTERFVLIQNQRDCPHELTEAISSLIFAASRFGESPELHEIRRIFTSRYGKEFADSAVELSNSCGVNPQMIQKMSTKQPSLESRMKVMKEIASENGITLEFDEFSSSRIELEQESNLRENRNQTEPRKQADVGGNSESFGRTRPEKDSHHFKAELDREKQFYGSMEAEEFTDVASAAQAAFESAAYAAVAARAAVELSRFENQDKRFR